MALFLLGNPTICKLQNSFILLGNPTMVYVSNKTALLLHGNPTVVYPSHKMAILLCGFVGNTKTPLFLVRTINNLRLKTL